MSHVHFQKLFNYKFATGISKYSALLPQKSQKILKISLGQAVDGNQIFFQLPLWKDRNYISGISIKQTL